MKRFLRFVAILIALLAFVALLATVAGMALQINELSTQINELAQRVQRLEEANAGRAVPAPASQSPSMTPTRTPTTPPPAPTSTPTASGPTPTPTLTNTPGPSPTSAPTRTSTATSVPTATPTPRPTTAPTATRTPRPTRTATSAPTATHTPEPDPYFTVNTGLVNVRTGPGNTYPIIGTVAQGERFDISARNPANSLRATWLQFCCVNEQSGWVYAPLLIVSHELSAIPIATDIPAVPTSTATPVPPTATNTPIPPTAAPVPPTATASSSGGSSGAGNLGGIRIVSENRCSHYNADDYSYPQSVEPQIIAQQGGRIYSPYTGRYFANRGETDIEHIVARSEAHDSGLCAADNNTRRAFARDLLNLTLASPSVNRHQKVDKDVAQWLPALNPCWYVNQVVMVKRKYNLTMDRAEATAAERVLAGCSSTAMQFTEPGSAPAPPPTATPPPASGAGGNCDSNPLGCYDDNGNGRITCAEARRHGIAPVPRSHPAYQYMRDGDSDGVVCE